MDRKLLRRDLFGKDIEVCLHKKMWEDSKLVDEFILDHDPSCKYDLYEVSKNSHYEPQYIRINIEQNNHNAYQIRDYIWIIKQETPCRFLRIIGFKFC